MDHFDDIVARSNECAQLRRLLDSVVKGRGQVVLLSGEPGVGKTRLANAALRQNGLKVYAGRSIERATAPYGPIAGALRDCLRQAGGTAEDCGPLGKYLGVLLPELGPTPAQGIDAQLLVEAICAALLAKARSEPTALLLDDLHWADESTVDLLPILAERLQHERMAIVGTYRDDEIGRRHPMRRLKGELLRLRMLHEIPIEPFTREQTAEFLAALLRGPISAALGDLVFARTRGLPLFIEEFAETLQSGGYLRAGESGFEPESGRQIPVPETIRDTVALRLDALPEAARTQIEIAAVIGDEFELELLRDLAGSDAGLGELMESRFITETAPGRAAFRHTVTRDAILAGVEWQQRRDVNRRIAERLERRGAPFELIASHWSSAGDVAKARNAYLAAAGRSYEVHGYRDAVRCIERALDAWPVGESGALRISALEDMARYAQVAGLLDEAVRALNDVVASPIVNVTPQRKAEALRALATVLELRGDVTECIETRDKASRSFADAGMPAEAAIESIARSERLVVNAQPTLASAAGREALDYALQSKRADLEARAKGILAYALAMLGRIDDARQLAHEGLSTALSLNSPSLAAEAYRRLAGVAEYSSDFAHAKEAYTTALNYCRERGEDEHEVFCMGCMSYVFFRAGQWARSLDICSDIMRHAQRHPYPLVVAKAVTGTIKAYRGELKPAKKLLSESKQEIHAIGGVLGELIAVWSLAVTEDLCDRADEAEANYRKFLSMWEGIEEYHDAIPGLCSAATFFAQRHAEAGVSACANALSAIATATGNPEALAGLAFALGECALLDDDPREAAKHFQQAAAQFEPLEVPVEWARSEWRAGLAMAASSERDEAVSHLRNAYRTLRKLGARALSSRVARDLDALGEPIEERRGRSNENDVDAMLTRRQHDVAQLLADGLTNKEIAQKLFVSPRTVDMHVAHILDRLDCRSRTEAARKIAQLAQRSPSN